MIYSVYTVFIADFVFLNSARHVVGTQRTGIGDAPMNINLLDAFKRMVSGYSKRSEVHYL